MKLETIFREGIQEKLNQSGFIKLELGAGENRKVEGAITVDQCDLESIDIVTDLNRGIPLPDESVDEIHSYHFLEHVDDLAFFMREIHRVLKPGGKKIGTVPHFSNPYFYSDYTHKSFFGLYTFSYFDSEQKLFHRKVPVYYSMRGFEVQDIKIKFTSPFYSRYPVKKLFQAITNLCGFTKEFYEENLCYLFPAYEIEFVLEKHA